MVTCEWLQESLRIVWFVTSGPLLDACVWVGWGWTWVWWCCWWGCTSSCVLSSCSALLGCRHAGVWALRDCKTCQKSCSTWGVDTGMLPADPEPAHSEVPGLWGATRAGPGRETANAMNSQQNRFAWAKQPAKGSASLGTNFFQSCAALFKSFYWSCAQGNQNAPSLIWALHNQTQYFFSWL